MRAGCCADKSCKVSTCMTLPDGKTCGDCVHFARCEKMFSANPTGTTCDFFPRRFTLKVVA